MNSKLWGSLTTAAFFLTTVGTSASSYAGQPAVSDDSSDTNVSSEQLISDLTIFPSRTTSKSAEALDPLVATESIAPESTTLESTAAISPETPASPVAPANPVAIASPTTPEAGSSNEVAKVGEYQSQEEAEDPDAIALIELHSLNGRQAVTLFVQGIPVLTFLGSTISASSSTSLPTEPSSIEQPSASSTTEATAKIGSTQAEEPILPTAQPSEAVTTPATQDQNDPVWRASAIAARINQLHLNSIDASAITVRWNGDRERYLIQVNGEELVEMNPTTILPDTTNNPAEDALQATNRLRRLMGDAPPLQDIADRPRPSASTPAHLSFNTTRQFTGVASWYGPGFHGNRSASGEVFNQNALTAAHRSLPFGTQVRVTNLNTGQSVVVRITDRGPFSGRRVIDLSAGAARVIGLIQAGVAPVRLEVLRAVTASN
jgi:rare lipoprotein A